MTPSHLEMYQLVNQGKGMYSLPDWMEADPIPNSPAFEHHCLEMQARQKGLGFWMWFCLREVWTGKPNTSL